MKNAIFMSVALLAFGLLNTDAFAGPATDALSACLADNTTGKERKDLARWVFVGMAAHPEIRSLSSVTQADREGLDRVVATTVTKLMTEKCLSEARTALERDGNTSIQGAFSVMGQLAMQELMANPEVSASFSRFAKYIDQAKLASALSGK
ncbi:MAG: hypothetical protein D3M94_18020 [Rhodocyclales bacterium GT-UBC]|nr:MAG: hypothetical protein D3M94_18020 [Rhodocyclales bacterium GT-UBC]